MRLCEHKRRTYKLSLYHRWVPEPLLTNQDYIALVVPFDTSHQSWKGYEDDRCGGEWKACLALEA
jgi:hypothetical protein